MVDEKSPRPKHSNFQMEILKMPMTKEQINQFVNNAKSQALDALERRLKAVAVQVIEEQIRRLRGRNG